MANHRVGNSKKRYISRAQVGTKATRHKGASEKIRSEFESRKDGYFVWQSAKKNET